ncbi:MAG TPA: CHAT domain-containing protein, partial [Acidobacteriota bacterium]|nr:CHAT domain-containing protein [Acidobacteriota bacterium]
SIVMTQDLEDLAGMVLQPLAGKIGRGRVLIVPDGALQYIPFGCLPVKKASRSRQTTSRLLVAQNEIVMLPSASALSILRKETAGRVTKPVSVAIVADPVFDPRDERFQGKSTADSQSPTESVTVSAQKRIYNRILEREKENSSTSEGAQDVVNLRIPRLPFTRVEADQISKLVGAENSIRLVSFAANRQAITSGELSKYPYIHLATHGLIDADRPDLSALVFSLIDETGKPVDGYLRALDIYNLSLPAELVVLSACETGLGKQIKGEGMVGLTRGFMYAGAKRVIVSLWSVNDEATASLMTSFYRKMIRQKQSPAAALRAAQLEILKNPKWKAPFYWAPFMIQGEFR